MADKDRGRGDAQKARANRRNQLDSIFAQMPTNIKPKPGSKKVGDK